MAPVLFGIPPPLCVCVCFLFSTFFLSDTIKWFRLILYMSCPSPRLSDFFTESQHLLLENGIRNHSLGARQYDLTKVLIAPLSHSNMSQRIRDAAWDNDLRYSHRSEDPYHNWEDNGISEAVSPTWKKGAPAFETLMSFAETWLHYSVHKLMLLHKHYVIFTKKSQQYKELTSKNLSRN